MTKLNLLIVALWAVLGLCVGQIVQTGQCDPNIPLQEDLTLEQFEGTWYEIQRTESLEQNTDCAQFDIILNEDYDETVNVHHYGVRNNFVQESRGTARTAPIPAKLTLDLPKFGRPIDFWVLAGGNDTFTVVYNCENITPNSRSINLWILSQSRGYATPMVRMFIDTLLTNTLSIGLDSLQNVNHGDTACYVLPEINPGENVILPGRCDPNIPVQQNFDVPAFTGIWHQIASYYSENSDGNCVRAEYRMSENGVDVINSQVINQNLLTITGVATVASTDGSAKLKVILNIAPGVNVEQELWVLSTDYKGYAVSYSCEDLENNQKRIYSWILSRERDLSYESNLQVNRVIDSIIELNTNFYQQTDRSPESCFYFPEPSNGPVVFRGQCETEVPPVKQSFDALAYMGLWYNIELYPALFQDGTCSNAFYELKDDRVEVRNTQVKDETLDTIDAFGVLATEDGSAKLRVTFPIAGTNNTITTDYWVLDTDYNSYAFVYSCFNIDSDNMQVGSWKLSRSKTLSQTDNTAIERVMSTARVLDQRYFNEVNQTEAGCFFVPVAEERVPVVFPGQCDSSLGMANFDFARFEGIWHEIEAYPKIEQTGQCIKHDYRVVSPLEFNFISSSVDDQFSLETQGVVRATDNSGRLTITINTGGEVITIPFWIIDTDYIDYALAYACVNKEGGVRGVWSWKLSRTTELSSSAEIAIANAITNIDVLDNHYYWPVDHSERACYTLPVLGPGEPVILDGVCDTAIDGIPDFNPTWFSGRWRLLQSYPSDSQTGTCNEVTFDDIDGDSLRVTHEQVLDRTLNRVSGRATLSADGKGILQITFPGAESARYLILDTDYDAYALLYRCENINPSQKRVWSWKISRRNSFTDEANTAMNAIINNVNVLNNRYFADIDRTEAGCFYFPEADDNTPVIFRGRCDENINVVQNFDADAYQGLWHDIQSYPEPFQTGTCQNAYYALSDGVVDVYNTQVVNQELDTMSGTAVLASDDGSAKLDVTFEVAGINVTTNYWVLATDYDSYALVYSCRPVNEEYYLVSSWKLSRSKTLSTSASQAIDEVTKEIPVLDDRYYLHRDQSESGCFYFPEPEENKPVVFPGQCDQDIDTVQNFNFAEFQGTWYEIQAYPKDEQTGECVNHRYTYVNAQTLNFESSSVRNQIRNINAGAVIGSNGRLTITIASDGTLIAIPFWIIDVQYNDYALAYSCVNRNDSHRAVYSWKLSRTKQLSLAAESAINNAISNINVLDNRYYEIIDQSEEACFYLPDFAPGEPAIFPGRCDDSIKGVENFDLQRLIGRWRVIEIYPSGVETTCNEGIYSRSDQIDNLSVNAVHTYVVNTTLTSIPGTLRVASSDRSGTLRFTPDLPGTDSVDYVVLATNYESYALVYQCENIQKDQSPYRKVMSWKLSPNNALDQTAIDNINAIVNRIDVLDNRYYYNANHTEAGCFYFPEANDNLPVRFRGRCGENIRVVTDFNPDWYQGLWHDIQSYPEPFQTGTCQNAYYALSDGVVDVYNTQVVNQELDTMSGTAVLASDDGSAKLDVTFEVAGINVTTNYWVLATDYDSYALVYSCRPVSEDYYLVSSWKLSRSKTLSTLAIQAIDAVTNEIPVLDDRYYLHRDQSESGCFYFPEPEENKPVVFPGQCDPNIATVQNFNFAEFGGTWHEIEKYPYAVNEHLCIDHRFAFDASSNLLTHNSFHVRDQTLSLVNSGNQNLNSHDGSGKLTIDIIVGTEVQTIPFWILATDYRDYALAYGCVNINEDSRQIYSWKLSRTRQPSAQGTAAINVAMNNVNVLDNRYFDEIQQTDEACFYLPVLGPNEPVTFIGQCDPNINVISNFDAARYLGRWRLIETYYADFQVGTCSEAEYSAGDGNVIVVNSEVIDQTLNTTVGTAVASADGSGKLLVNFPPSTSSTDYWILGTDYDSYALVYSCRNIDNDRRRVWSWKMSRTNTLTESSVTAINEIVNSINVLDDTYYQTVDRTEAGCFYYPTPDAKTPVVFPGQCDETIPVVTNFDAAAYLGLWYDIESYPAPFQTGTCAKADYSLESENLVRVENTQIVNQRLETWIGSAVPSDDGTARLNVTFNVNGIDVYSNYWVLSTDYEFYALVYACENIDLYNRAVFSWKLSRTKALTAQANEAINNVIRNIEVLDDRYYFEKGHTDDDCFYYPDNKGGDVILDGQCLDDNAVPAITNFNAAGFAGVWHEVSRFPSDLQVGECDFMEFTFNPPFAFNIIASFINNEKQTNDTILATISNIRGVFHINAIDVPFTSVYVLDTDYDKYALMYACRNLDDKRKQIYSWKMSRSRSGLSDEANSTLDQLITDNRDLWQGYYKTTRQDNDACFYYPEFEEMPSSIRLPGSCPSNIKGVPNFNANNYLGKWFETARYPEPNQLGQCNRAEYSLPEAGDEPIVLVDNEEVAELTLFVQSGQAIVASTDGSGELLVRFVVDGEERLANYYILATDYNTYSLVYSCTNLPDGWRQVSSWQLSRTKSPVSNSIIDAAIADTQGLRSDLYQSTSQSDEDCFYIPFNHNNRAPRFRGQCEDIPRVRDLDTTRYGGWWHEIESFEIDGPHPGVCRSSEYNDLSGNTYRLVDTWVTQENNGIVLEGTVTVSEDGRLTKTLPDNNVQEIWVLATDYETYSLLYSCVNIDDEYRRVWSAKHSKTRSLTDAAKAAIDPIIRDTSVLYEQFYRTVDQTDEACFFYPDVTAGQVIIPGQCDLNIPVQQNFNMSSFAGVWYHTEQYDAVRGSCVGSNYVIGDDELIRVYDVEVVDGAEVHAEGAVTSVGAKIFFTYPVQGSEDSWEDSDVLVLGTDYENYAVLYNCENIGNYNRRVRVWKLSRGRTMSTVGNENIGALIRDRRELHQPYFNENEQNEDCPEPRSAAVAVKTSISLLLIGAILRWLL